ncbi:putative ATP-dependent RNA helicase TDRD12 [Hemiscyllium ocellatum]|uniref:putative ATP-dependent RNA helicase TDRD12 n=1 Tax=Hemiscyllium ocellatum TaxID=170820 RepID=UPI002966BB95|nr:putative ATP-dependent RNA helicase TDRD12 [Hemiscyllium ocellatum]
MFEIFIIKVEDPSCFWGRITNGFSELVENANQYQRLEEKMNQVYNRRDEDSEEIKLPVLEQGQICAIYCHELRCWCRAILESLVSSGSSYLAECFLVDYAKHILVKANDVRRAVDVFWKLPYRAKKFTLFGIQPMTLHVDVCEEKAKIGPALRWDSAAIHYFQKMSRESDVAEAKLQSVTGDTFAVQLYLSLNDEKVCLNDDLVAKFFACYVSPKCMVKSLNSSSEITSALCQKKEAPVKKNVGHAALAVWSETVQGTVRTTLNQGPAVQKSVTQCLQSQERVFSENMNKQYTGTAVSLSNKKSTESLASFSFCSLENKLDCKRARFYLRDDMRMGRDTFKAMQECDEIPAARSYPSYKMAFDLCNGVLVHSLIKLRPCRSMEMSPISLDLKKELCKKKIVSPNVVQGYCWPAIGRGCDLIAISQKGDDPLLYLPPLLTFLQLPSMYNYQPRRNLPLAIIVCPGRQKAHFVYQTLTDLIRTSRLLSLSLVLVGQDPEEMKKIKFTKGCDVVVTTPHSLVRVLQMHCLFFIRLSHLVLDRVDVLFDEAMDEVNTILQCFKEATNVPERGSTPQQLIAVGQIWSKKMESLLKENQSDPYVVITAMEEAALYGNVHQVVKVCLDCEKTSILLTMLDFTSETLQKTVIFANCAEEVDHVFKALGSNSHFCMKVHEGMSLQVSNIMDDWSKKFNPGTHMILVTTDNCLRVLRITDATCVIHYGFPSSCEIFGTRLCCMVDNFDNLTTEVPTRQRQSVVLLTEKDALQTVSVLHYLERTEAKIPQELFQFILNMNNIDDIYYDRALCKYLKAYGICRDNKTCPSRHKFLHDVDKPRYLTAEKKLPSTGYIEIIPTCVNDASDYYGRIIHHRSKWEDLPVSMEEDYLMLLKDMTDYYLEDDHRKPVEQLEVSAFYGLEENSYSRVQLLALPEKAESAVLRSARVKYIDSGQTGLVMQKQLLKLPAKFQVLPPQVVEFIICRVKPIDNEMDWNPQVSRYIKQKITNKSHEAKIVLALGNTLWLNPVVRMAKLADLKTTILEYNIRSQIMNSGFGTDNAEHIERLKGLCRVAGLGLPNEDSPRKQLHYYNKLEHVTLQNDGNYHSVVISEFSSPKKFHVQLVATREAWHRVKILSIVDSKRIYKVFFMDFGTCSYISLNNIQPLLKDALKLPFQAICCSLFGVEPVEKLCSREIKEWSWTTLQDKELQVKVIEQSRNDLTDTIYYYVVVRDPSNAGSEKLAERMRSKGPGIGPPAILNQLFSEEAVKSEETSYISYLCSLVKSGSYYWGSLHLIHAMASVLATNLIKLDFISKSRTRDLDEINEEKGIDVLVNLLQGVTSAELQESTCVALGILSENTDLRIPIIDANALKYLDQLLKMPIETNVWEAILGALDALLYSSRVCEEIEQQAIICHPCAKVEQSSKDKVLENVLKVLCYLSGRPQSLNLNVLSGLVSTIDSLLVHKASKTALYKVANNLGSSLAILQTLHCPQNDATCCEENTGIINLPEDRPNQLTMDPKSFHPEIKWHQKEDHLMLNVKLRNFTEHSCKFGHCRVVFSAYVGTKLYLANLELKDRILKEKSSCVIKNEEPFIILFKQEKGEWSSLLKFKNPNVTFDFNYLEEVADDVTLPIWRDIRRNEKQVVMEPIIDDYDSFTSTNDSSEDDY